jgi:TPR repeat protein
MNWWIRTDVRNSQYIINLSLGEVVWRFPNTLYMRSLLGLTLLFLSIAVQSQESATNVKQPPKATFAELTRQAQAGSAAAQLDLGMIYESGKGVPKDEVQAAEWFNKAAAQGNAKAQTILGRMYRDGEGVTQDYVKAVYWLQKAAEQGVAEAQGYLGTMYGRGTELPIDYAKRVYWCSKAAEQGNAWGQACLGSAYHYGEGVPKNTAKAMDLYVKASAQGFATASSALYMMYKDGDGVPKNSKIAISWLRKAAKQGDSWSQYMLAVAYEQGDGTPQNMQLAVKWYKKAAAQGDNSAQVRLARMYGNGQAVPRDLVISYALYNIAAASEFASGEEQDAAALGMDNLKKVLTSAQIAEAERLSLADVAAELAQSSSEPTRKPRDALKVPEMECSSSSSFTLGTVEFVHVDKSSVWLSKNDCDKFVAGVALPSAVQMRGNISRADIPVFKALLAPFLDPKYFETHKTAVWYKPDPDESTFMVTLDSPGGDVISAIELGRLFRKARVTVAVGVNDKCLSSCIFLLAGSVHRILLGGAIGIHRPYLNDTAPTTFESLQTNTTHLNDLVSEYLKEMNIPTVLFDDMMRVPSEQIKILNSSDLDLYGLRHDDPVFAELQRQAEARAIGLPMSEYLPRKAAYDRCVDRLYEQIAAEGKNDLELKDLAKNLEEIKKGKHECINEFIFKK